MRIFGCSFSSAVYLLLLHPLRPIELLAEIQGLFYLLFKLYNNEKSYCKLGTPYLFTQFFPDSFERFLQFRIGQSTLLDPGSCAQLVRNTGCSLIHEHLFDHGFDFFDHSGLEPPQLGG